MNLVTILTHQLHTFIEELHLAGYNIGTTHFITAQHLILSLAKQGTLPPLAQLKTLLGPILCHSPKEQEDFHWRFDNWIKQINAQTTISPKPRPIITKITKLWKWGLVTITILMISIFLYRVFLQSTTTVDSLISPTITVLTIFTVTSSVLLLLYLFIFQPWQRYFTKLYLVKKFSAFQPDMNLLVKELDKTIFQPIHLWRTAQQLRQPLTIATNHLDLTATIAKTVQSVGWFTPLLDIIQHVPEYLILIDRITCKDHQTEFVNSLLKQLIAEGVIITRYYFEGDPRRCYPEQDHLPPFTLIELAKLYPNQYLLIFADSNNFINPVTGEMVSWMAEFSPWLQRFLFTLEIPDHWGHRERLLENADFLILPANDIGLKYLAEQINANSHQSYHPPFWQKETSRKNLANFPKLLNDYPQRWLEHHAPTRAELTELLTQIHLFLGTDGYYWLAACAVYPELHWQLTLYLGDKLTTIDGKKLLTEENLAKLVRLPWFRYGYLPNWLRKRLVKNLLTQNQNKEIYTAIEELLKTATEKTSPVVDLGIATNPPKYSEKDNNPLQEQVFVTFMADKLAVTAFTDRITSFLTKNATT